MNNIQLPIDEVILTPELKQEWLEKVSVYESEEVYTPRRKRYNTKLYLAPKCIREDEDVNFTALTIGKEFFTNIDEKFKKDKLFIKKLISAGYKNSIYENLSYQLREDKEIFQLCIERKERCYFIPQSIINDKDLVLELVKKYDIFSLLDKKYDLDKDVLTVQLERDPTFYRSLKKRMYNYFSAPKRKPFLLILFKKNPYNITSLYQHLPIYHQEDLDFVHEVLSASSNNIVYIAPTLLADKGFVMYAIEKYNCDTKACPREIQDDIDVAKLLLEKDGSKMLKNYKHHDFSRNPDLIELALKTYNKLDLLPFSLYDNKDLVIKFLQADPQNCTNLFNLTQIYVEDKDILRIVMKTNLSLFEKSITLRNDTELCELAISLSNNAMYLNDILLENRDLVIRLLQENPHNCDKFFEKPKALYLYNDDREIAEIVTHYSPDLIKHFYNLKSDKEFVKAIMKKGLKNIESIDPSLYYDEEIAKGFIYQNANLYNKLPLEMKNKEEIAFKAVRSGIEAPAFYNTKFKTDVEFYKKAIQLKTSFYNHNFPENLKFNTDIVLAFCSSYNSYYNTMPKFVVEHYNTNVIEHIKKQVENEILKNKLEESLPTNTVNKNDLLIDAPIVKKMKI